MEKICSLCNVSIKNIKKNVAFERKVNYSGRSLIISIPDDVVKYMNITKGQEAKIIPIDKKSFMVEF